MFQTQQLGHTGGGLGNSLLEHPLVAAHNFIVATRETGYRSVATAVAELIDNAVQAKATDIHIFVLHQPSERAGSTAEPDITIAVLDDGEGMDSATLWTAL